MMYPVRHSIPPRRKTPQWVVGLIVTTLLAALAIGGCSVWLAKGIAPHLVLTPVPTDGQQGASIGAHVGEAPSPSIAIRKP